MTLYDPSLHDEPADSIHQSLRTYHGVLVALRYVVLAHIVVGSFLILAFATQASYLTAFAVAVIELAVGLYLARDRKRTSWLSDAGNLFISTSTESGAPHE